MKQPTLGQLDHCEEFLKQLFATGVNVNFLVMNLRIKFISIFKYYLILRSHSFPSHCVVSLHVHFLSSYSSPFIFLCFLVIFFMVASVFLVVRYVRNTYESFF